MARAVLWLSPVMNAVTVGVLVGLLAVGATALAHGGEDHGAPEPVVAAPAGTMRAAEAVSSRYEAVVRWEMRGAGEATDVVVWLADFATSAPVTPTAGAEIKLGLHWTGPGDVRADARAAGEPGRFAARTSFAAVGHYALVVTVNVPGAADVLLVSDFSVGPAEVPAVAEEEAHSEGVPALWLALAVGLGLAFALIGFLAGRRRTAGAVVVTLALLIAWGDAAPPGWTHGGEDHGTPTAVTAPSGSWAVTLPLEAQFLLALRTERVTARELVERLRVTGKVTAPPGAFVALSAPNAARVEASGERAFPRLGERVQRGDVLALLVEQPGAGDRASIAADRIRANGEAAAALARSRALKADLERKRALTGIVSEQELADAQAAYAVAQAELRAAQAMAAAMAQDGVALRLPLIAPIDGIVASVAVGPGSVVAPGEVVLSVLDATTLWVVGRVFEGDLARVDASVTALVTADTLVGERVAAPVAVSPRIDPATRTQDVVFAVQGTPEAGGADALRLEQHVWLDLAAGAPVRGTVVPSAALVDIDGRPAVWVKTGPERFEPRSVAVAARAGAWVAVRGLVHVGERVVTSGAAFLLGAAVVPAQQGN